MNRVTAIPPDVIAAIDSKLRAAGDQQIPLPFETVMIARAGVHMIAEGDTGTSRREAGRRAWVTLGDFPAASDPRAKRDARLGQARWPADVGASCVGRETATTQGFLLAQAWVYLTYGAHVQGPFLAEVPAWAVSSAARLTHAARVWMDGVDVDVAVQRADDLASGVPRPRKKRVAGEPLPDLTSRTMRALDGGLEPMPVADLVAWLRTSRHPYPRHGSANPWAEDQDVRLLSPDDWCRDQLTLATGLARFWAT